MPTYYYKVKDRSGKTRTGSIEAPSERTAAAMIREAGGLPMQIRLADGAHSPAPAPVAPAVVRYLIHPLWTGVNIRGLMFFFRQLATLLRAGMSLAEALRSVSERTNGALGRILRQAHVRVQGGGRLSEELSRHPRVFSSLQISLIGAGEESGSLEMMTDRVATYLEYEMSVRRRIVAATWYPVLILAFAGLQPVLVEMVIGSANAALALLLHQVWAYVVPIVLVVVAAKLVFQFFWPRLIWDTIKTGLPVLGMISRKIAMSRFSKALALLYSSGVPVSRAVSIAADASANTAVAEQIKKLVPALSEGQSLTQSLARSRVILPVVMDMLAVGEKTGNYDAVLQKVAGYMEDEVDASIHKLTVVLFVLMIVGAGAVVLTGLVAGYSEIFGGILREGM